MISDVQISEIDFSLANKFSVQKKYYTHMHGMNCLNLNTTICSVEPWPRGETLSEGSLLKTELLSSY